MDERWHGTVGILDGKYEQHGQVKSAIKFTGAVEVVAVVRYLNNYS